MSFEQFGSALDLILRFDLEALEGMLVFARTVRYLLIAQAAAAARVSFREKLSADLKLHASWAHRLTKPLPPPALLPQEALQTLQEQADDWRTSLARRAHS